MENRCRIRNWLRRFGVQISFFYLGLGLAIILILSGTIYFFTASLLMNEMVSKTHDLLELSGNNIATYIARVKGESDVFANSPVLRQYLEENDESLRPALMSDIEQLLKK